MADMVPAGGETRIDAWNFPWKTRVRRDGRVDIAPERRQAGEKAAAGVIGAAALFTVAIGIPWFVAAPIFGIPILTNLVRGYAPWPKISLDTHRVRSHQRLHVTVGSGRKRHEVRAVRANLSLEERAEVRANLGLNLISRRVSEAELAPTALVPDGKGYYSFEVPLPAFAIHSFATAHCFLVWSLHFYAEIDTWPPIGRIIDLNDVRIEIE